MSRTVKFKAEAHGIPGFDGKIVGWLPVVTFGGDAVWTHQGALFTNEEEALDTAQAAIILTINRLLRSTPPER